MLASIPNVASHDDQVGRQDRDSSKGIDCVQRGRGADVDEGDERHDADGCEDGMDWDVER